MIAPDRQPVPVAAIESSWTLSLKAVYAALGTVIAFVMAPYQPEHLAELDRRYHVRGCLRRHARTTTRGKATRLAWYADRWNGHRKDGRMGTSGVGVW